MIGIYNIHNMKNSTLLLASLFLIITSCGSSENEASSDTNKVVTPEASSEKDKTESVSINSIIDCIETSDLEAPPLSCISELDPDPLVKEQVDSIAYHTILRMYDLAQDIDLDDYIDEDTYDLNEKAIKKYTDWGFTYDQEEGFYFLTVDFNAMHKWFYPFAGDEMKAYLDFKVKNREKISYDAGLVIEPMEMAKRLCEMEKLLKSGTSQTRELLSDFFVYELSWVYLGLDNTPAFDWETHEYLPEFQETLNYLIKNGGTVIKHFTKTMEMEMEKSKNKYTEDLNKWINYEAVGRKTEATYPLN